MKLPFLFYEWDSRNVTFYQTALDYACHENLPEIVDVISKSYQN